MEDEDTNGGSLVSYDVVFGTSYGIDTGALDIDHAEL
jgi:hypothetical protein